MKRKICRVLCLLLVVSGLAGLSPRGVLVADAAVGYESLLALIHTLEVQLAQHPAAERSAMYHSGRPYFETNEGIDALIAVVNGDANTVPQSIADFADYFSARKSELLFVLRFIRSLPESERQRAIRDFTDRTAYPDLTRAEEDALNAVYAELVGAEFRDALATDHRITAKVFLSLLSCIRGSFTLTDDRENTNKLALDDPPAYGKEVLTDIIKNGNTSASNAAIANYKRVFEILDMYTPYKSTSGGGPGGGNPPRVPVNPPVEPPPNVPVQIPAPSPDTEELLSVLSGLPDALEHWSAPYLAVMVGKGVFRGYGDGTFRPDLGITRQEIAVALVRALRLEARLGTVEETPFDDGGDIAEWARDSVALLLQLQIYKGYGDGTFRPLNIISREEMTAVLERSVAQTPNGAVLPFADKDDISGWALASVEKAFALGIVRGYEDNTFRPLNDVTRGETATMMYNFMTTEHLFAED
ncbi:MAG: S-layer homology domain-containing protein [Clostridiales bacterium]|jgi:hypothetical protein|nr:S-layer homology domain-containing protein [Clostridiales bacterium]